MRMIAALLLYCALTAAYAEVLPEVLPNAQLAAPPVPPPGFIPPPLNPTGVLLETRELASNVYALMSNTPFADNAGFVVGDEAVLVIDSHFNGEMGQQIIDAVRQVSDLPIRYLLNTNAFGDHVFGNYVFPAQTQIVAHQGTIDALSKSSVQGIARTMRGTVDGDLSVFDGVELRIPDVGFDRQWSVELGNTVVEMHWFGPSMSPHDSVVFLPKEKIAWTANMIFGAGTIPWARGGDLVAYKQTLVNFAEKINPQTIVSGHGDITDGDAVPRYLNYIDDTLTVACNVLRDGDESASVYANAELDAKYPIEPTLERLMTGFHRWNLKAVMADPAQCAAH